MSGEEESAALSAKAEGVITRIFQKRTESNKKELYNALMSVNKRFRTAHWPSTPVAPSEGTETVGQRAVSVSQFISLFEDCAAADNFEAYRTLNHLGLSASLDKISMQRHRQHRRRKRPGKERGGKRPESARARTMSRKRMGGLSFSSSVSHWGEGLRVWVKDNSLYSALTINNHVCHTPGRVADVAGHRTNLQSSSFAPPNKIVLAANYRQILWRWLRKQTPLVGFDCVAVRAYYAIPSLTSIVLTHKGNLNANECEAPRHCGGSRAH